MSSDMGIISEDPRVVNIQVQQQLTRTEIQALPLTNRLDNNSTLKKDLFEAYRLYIESSQYIRTRSIKIYRYIRYMLLDDHGEFYAHIKLHIGDVIVIKEE